ncbi:MAG: PfkB family carbohydrate kinase [Rhodobacteraceae bacterium]|jgi:5-dehydro-2-deoxygluconokinase|nr:PfkB family carbohydrate kinase [Paracoccaceae bacterium]
MQRLWRRMALNHFLILGRVGMDLYADPPGTKLEDAGQFMATIGGSAGNIAVALARQGARAALLSCVADDAVGRFCLARLAEFGVDTTHVRTVGGPARNALAVTETRIDDTQVALYRNGAADLCLTEAQVEGVDFASLSALVVTGTALSAMPSRAVTLLAMGAARAAGAIVVLDIDHRPSAWATQEEAARICRAAADNADIVIGNEEEFALLAGDMAGGRLYAQRRAQADAMFTIYKRGAAGAVTFTPDFGFTTGVFPVRAQKPMGAGDGFMGGLLAALAQGATLEAAVQRGAATAAIIVAGVGCAPASPTAAELAAFMARV